VPNYVPDKAKQDQEPGGFSLAAGRPPGDTAAGALSTGNKLESRRGRWWRDIGRRTQAGVHGPPARRRSHWRALGRRDLGRRTQAGVHGPPARRRGRWRALGRRHQA